MGSKPAFELPLYLGGGLRILGSDRWASKDQTTTGRVELLTFGVWFLDFLDSRSPTRCPLSDFFSFGGGSPTKIDYSKKGTLILDSLLEDLLEDPC